MLNSSIVSYRVHTLNIKLKTIQAYKNTQKKQEDPYSYKHTYAVIESQTCSVWAIKYCFITFQLYRRQ